MGTEVLRPQDCLTERIRVPPVVFHQNRRRNLHVKGDGNPNPSPNPRVSSRKPAARSEQKKRSEKNGRLEPLASRRFVSVGDLKDSHGNQQHLVAGHVTILRRGESLDSKIGGVDRRLNRPAKKASDDLVLCGTARQVRIGDLRSAGNGSDVYAGSAFSTSPSPRSLPLPSFFGKKEAPRLIDDSATRDLRRLLRLN